MLLKFQYRFRIDVVIVLLVFFIPKVYSNLSDSNNEQNPNLADEWHKDIKKSLSENIHGKCNVTSSKWNSQFPSDITLTLNFPSKKEVHAYKKRPTTISRANSKLLYVMNSTRLHSFFYLEKGSRWMIPDQHPGQLRDMCRNVSHRLGSGHTTNTIYNDYYKIPIERVSYLLKGRNAIISDTGTVWFECGHYQGNEACETRWNHIASNWMDPCKDVMKKQQISWNQLLTSIARDNNDNNNPSSIVGGTVIANADHRKELIKACCFNNTAAQVYKKVFVITASIDNNFHHLISDQLSRIVRYLPFLRNHPHVMVHVREWETYEPGYKRQDYEIYLGAKTRKAMLSLLGIDSSRLVSRTVIATQTVYIPRAMSCSDALRNPTEIRLLANEFIKRAQEVVYLRKRLRKRYEPSSFMMTEEQKPVVLHHQVDNYETYESTLTRKNLILLVRKSIAWGARFWTDAEHIEIVKQLELKFPEHNIVSHTSDSILHPEFCYACEIMEMTTADILVGMHGAGLSKMMFMPPGAVVMEISAHFNDAQMPVCGYYGNWAHMFGHHHYLYAYNGDNGAFYDEKIKSEKLEPIPIADELLKYYNYIHSEESAALRAPSHL